MCMEVVLRICRDGAYACSRYHNGTHGHGPRWQSSTDVGGPRYSSLQLGTPHISWGDTALFTSLYPQAITMALMGLALGGKVVYGDVGGPRYSSLKLGKPHMIVANVVPRHPRSSCNLLNLRETVLVSATYVGESVKGRAVEQPARERGRVYRVCVV
jgi:hypothetical protein